MNRILQLLGVLTLCAISACAKPSANAYSTDPAVIEHGEKLALQYCFSCHYIEKDGSGPALGGITEVIETDWLLRFIKDPMKVVASGDAHAVRLFEQYKIPMPGFAMLPDSDLLAILSYIRDRSFREDISYDINADRGNLIALMATPHEPIVNSDLGFSLTEVAAIPSDDRKPEAARISTLRYRPDQPDQHYISDQDGFIYHLTSDGPKRVLDISQHRPAFIDAPGLATGLGSFAFHPEFATNRLVYVTHTEKVTDQKTDYSFNTRRRVRMQWILSVIELPTVDAAFDSGTWRELLRINVPRHVHGMQEITFSRLAQPGAPDYGILYIGFGDGGSTRQGFPDLTHDLRSPLGTIMRIDPTGSNSRNGQYGIPPDNPFVNHADSQVWPEIFAWGLRNPHRLTWDHLNHGRLIAGDIGERLFEEINVILPGRDYGWNVREAHLIYHPDDETESAPTAKSALQDDKFESPIAVYSHMEGRAISGGFVYRGSIAELHGKYIFGDIVSGRVFYLDMKSDTTGLQPIRELNVLNEAGAPYPLRERVKNDRVDLHFGEDAAGELYLITKADGKIRRVIAAKPE